MGMKPGRSPVPDGRGMAPVIDAMRTLNTEPLTVGVARSDRTDADHRRRQGFPRCRRLGDPQPHDGGSELEIVAGRGHGIYLEDPEGFAARLGDFLARHLS